MSQDAGGTAARRTEWLSVEYGEELGWESRDPEARDAARRLLRSLPVAATPRCGRSSLRVLLELARREEERRRILALIYLTDPRHNRDLLAAGSAPTGDRDSCSTRRISGRAALIRQGQGATAKALLEKKPVHEELARGEVKMSLAELSALAAERSLTAEQLAKVLRAELALDPAARRAASGQGRLWSQAARSHELTPVQPLSIERLTEFDPSECVFRGGKWQQP